MRYATFCALVPALLLIPGSACPGIQLPGECDRPAGGDGPAACVPITWKWPSRNSSRTGASPTSTTHRRERIDINLLLTINSQPAPDRFEGNLAGDLRPPVLRHRLQHAHPRPGGQQRAVQLLGEHADRVHPDRHLNNLSSLLGFYAYFILGLDADSFSPTGGTPFYTLAQQVVNNAQSASESRLEGLRGPAQPLLVARQSGASRVPPVPRPALQLPPHRHGHHEQDAITTRRTIAQGIEKLKTVHQAKPASYNLQVFFNAKYNEMVEIFKQADAAEKTKLFNTLQIIDPGHISQYQNMMRGS
jgi:hypothetical protein